MSAYVRVSGSITALCNQDVWEDDGDPENGPHVRVAGLCTKQPGHDGPHEDLSSPTAHLLQIIGHDPADDIELPIFRIGRKLFTRVGPGLFEDVSGYVLLSEVLDELIGMLGDSHSNVSRFEMFEDLALAAEMREMATWTVADYAGLQE